MSDQIKHECGIAIVRLLKPLSFYKEKYGTPFYGVNKLYLLMEKQHNRGQDGAGVANINLMLSRVTGILVGIAAMLTNLLQKCSIKSTHDLRMLQKNFLLNLMILPG